MVDGVRFNPFTGKLFSASEIEMLDENKDGIVSVEELNKYIYLLAGGKDEEGAVIIDGTNGSGNCKAARVTDDMKNAAINNSKLKDDYYGTKYKILGSNKSLQVPKMGHVEEIRATLNEFAESLKVQLKNQLGADYDEQKINKFIKSAINTTILENCKNAANFKLSYNIKDLIDKFVENFNKLVDESNNPSAQTEPFSKADVLGSDDRRMQQYIQGGWKTDGAGTNEAILTSLIPGLKESIKSHCPNMSDSDIDRIIQQSKSETLELYNDKAYERELIDYFLNSVESKINEFRTLK